MMKFNSVLPLNSKVYFEIMARVQAGALTN